VTAALRRYARSFTGFERDARIFLLATLVYGVTLSLWWVDFNLYLASLHFDAAFIGLVATAGSAAGAVAAFPASLLSDRIGRRLVLVLATAELFAGPESYAAASAATIPKSKIQNSKLKNPFVVLV